MTHRRRIAAIVLTLCVAAMLQHASTRTANAENSAVVRMDYSCRLILPGLFLTTTDTHFVETSSGNMSATCRFVIPPGQSVPDQAVKLKNLNCNFFGIFTNDCTVTITPAGVVILKAHLNPGS